MAFNIELKKPKQGGLFSSPAFKIGKAIATGGASLLTDRLAEGGSPFGRALALGSDIASGNGVFGLFKGSDPLGASKPTSFNEAMERRFRRTGGIA